MLEGVGDVTGERVDIVRTLRKPEQRFPKWPSRFWKKTLRKQRSPRWAFVGKRLLGAESLQMEAPQFGGRSRFFTGRRILKENRKTTFHG